MSYLWEDYESKNEYVLALQKFCPYTEIFQTVNNVSRVNLLYRFAKVRESLNDCFESEEMLQNCIGKKGFDTLFHLLANIDFFAGISIQDLQMMDIYEEICRGYYGIEVVLFEKFRFEHKYKILSYMIIRRNNKCRNNIFFDCITELFDVSLNYSEFSDTYIIQIHSKKEYIWDGKYTSQDLYNVVKELLCDFWLKVEVYWSIPIGILGEEMKIEKVQII